MRRNLIHIAVVLGVAAHAVRVGYAMPISTGGGYDYYEGPSQLTRSVLGIVATGTTEGNQFSLVGVRFDDSVVGEGNGVVAGVGLAMNATTKLRVWGSRFVGDETFRSWRVKTGPWFSLPRGGELGFYFAHYEDNADGRTDAGIAELGVPLVPQVTGRASAAYAHAPGDLGSQQGSLGVDWSPISRLTLSGELGIARNGALGTGATPASRRPLLPILGGGGGGSGASSEPKSSTDPTFQLGFRVTFP